LRRMFGDMDSPSSGGYQGGPGDRPESGRRLRVEWTSPSRSVRFRHELAPRTGLRGQRLLS
jgi:hypothetical protein